MRLSSEEPSYEPKMDAYKRTGPREEEHEFHTRGRIVGVGDKENRCWKQAGMERKRIALMKPSYS